jgi:hypothetical protein
MPMLAAGSPLVASNSIGRSEAMAEKIRTVKVMRAFHLKAIVQPVGAVIEVAESLARELIALGKAQWHSETQSAEDKATSKAEAEATVRDDARQATETRGKK